MTALNGKTKIALVVVGFVVFAVFMFWLGYGILGGANTATADSIAKRRVELDTLRREQKSFEQGKIDLAELSKSAYPPADLFSSDTKLVKEIQQLEDFAHKYNLEMSLSVAGTADKAQKVTGTVGDLFTVPYTISLTGDFGDTLLYLQSIERLPFITHVKMISVLAGDKGQTNTTISSDFFLKK